MKKRFDYIYNEPPRVLVMLGINLEAFQCLTAQVEKAHWGLNWRLQVLPASLYEKIWPQSSVMVPDSGDFAY